MSIGPVRLNHAVLFVTDLARSEGFYTDVFGMVVASREPGADAVFLRLPRSVNDHDLGLMSAGPYAPPRRRGGIGLCRLAWQVDTIDDLERARTVLAEIGVYTREASRGPTRSVYGADPDGNEFGIVWMLPREEWSAHASADSVERLDLAAEAGRWSGVATAGTIGHV